MGINHPKKTLLFLALPLLLILTVDAASQRHRISIQGNKFFMDDMKTNRRWNFDMWNTRLANALFDRKFTDRVVANLDDYLRYGVNSLSIGIQGGNMGSTNANKIYPRVYNADGTLMTSSVVWSNLKVLLEETDKRGMALMIQYWYFRRDENVPSESNVLKATQNVTQWLKDTGYRHYVLDIVNEFTHPMYDNRSVFNTLTGALKLINAVEEVDSNVLHGISPKGLLFAPEGTLTTSSGKKWIEADIVYSHNGALDPMRGNSYILHGLPTNPNKPYVNNEFNSQLGYERYSKTHVRTGKESYGHWDQATIDKYIADMRKIRGYGGYVNVFSHRQQYIPREATMPIAEIGPAGTQPEASSGSGEPSMHWLFEAIAKMRKKGPLSNRADFNGALTPGGFETDLGGKWAASGGEFRQSDANADPAAARLIGGTADVVFAFESGFLADPGKDGRLGIQVGAAGVAGPAYRLLIGNNVIELDQLGGNLPRTTVTMAKGQWDQYCLIVRDGKVRVQVNGNLIIDLDEVTPLAPENLLLVTKKATASFDNLRVGPHTMVAFDDDTVGDWRPIDPNAWKVVADTRSSNNKLWQASAGINDVRHAVLDLALTDLEFEFKVDFGDALFAGFRFRTTDLANAMGDGYLLRVSRDGSVMLDRIDGAAPPKPLGYGQASIAAGSAHVRVGVEGQRILVFIDNERLFDVVDTGTPLAAGGLALLTYGGRVRFDELHLQTGPNLPPRTGASGNRLAAGMALTVSDPDGALDFSAVRLFLDKGDAFGFQDVTFALHKQVGLFAVSPSVDGKGAVARLLRDIHLGSQSWKLRLRAVDHDGNADDTDVELKSTAP